MALAEIDVTPDALPLDSIICGDALDVLRTLPDNSLDSIVTDPPYGLSTPPDMVDVLRAWLAGEAYTPRGKGFMGKAWDAFVPGPEYWRECLRVLKPGGHLLAFAGTRTWDVMGLALRLAGFEIRDTLQWLHGQGFPKSLDVGKQLDKMAGAKRKSKGASPNIRPNSERGNGLAHGDYGKVWPITAPATDAARQWDGYGTALKPAWEPIILCRKPLAEPTVAANVLRWGTGALNIDGSRIAHHDDVDLTRRQRDFDAMGYQGAKNTQGVALYKPQGRWPANLLLSHSLWCDETTCALDCPVRALDAQSGIRTSGNIKPYEYHGGTTAAGLFHSKNVTSTHQGDTGGASRYFQTFKYTAKASRSERNRGCSSLDVKAVHRYGAGFGRDDTPTSDSNRPVIEGNHHPTVKSLALMSWLITLITPPGGIVLDPFAGSGSTLVAAKEGGWRFIGIEKEAEYVTIARSRVQAS